MKVQISADRSPDVDNQIGVFAEQLGGEHAEDMEDGTLVYVFEGGTDDENFSHARQFGGLLNQARVVTTISYVE